MHRWCIFLLGDLYRRQKLTNYCLYFQFLSRDEFRLLLGAEVFCLIRSSILYIMCHVPTVCSLVSDSSKPHGWWPARLLCPWDSPSKNTGVGLPFLTAGNLPNPEIESTFLASAALAVGFLTTVPLGKLLLLINSFLGGSDSKESAHSAGDLGLIPGLGRCHGGGHGNPLQYSCLENPHGQRSLVGHSPWGCKELDATKHSTWTCLTHEYYVLFKMSQEYLHPYGWIFIEFCGRGWFQGRVKQGGSPLILEIKMLLLLLSRFSRVWLCATP